MLKEIRAVVCFGLIVLLALTLSACSTGTPNGGRHQAAGGKASDAQIVFEASPTAGGSTQEIFTMNLDGSKRTQITHDGLNKFLPHFSPDGTQLVYTKFLVGGYGTPNAQTDVVVYDFASGKETQLTHTGNSWQPVWSPDGRRIAYDTMGTSLRIMNADGSNNHLISTPSGTLDGKGWGDPAWSSDDWILFVVGQDTNSCFKTWLDKIRPDGTARTQVTDGGPNCTPKGREQNGDADPGFSADGKTIYSSRGLPRDVPGLPGQTLRHLYSFSSDAWTAGKVESDLSLPSAQDCIAGVPKGSPDGTRVLLFRFCAGDAVHSGVTLTDKAGSYWTWIAGGFGPDWNPASTGKIRNGRVACAGPDSSGVLQIFTYASDGTDRKQLTHDGANQYPSWSPDGTQILFSTTRTGVPFGRIWIMAADGSHQHEVSSTAPGGITPFMSPDGQRIAFSGIQPEVGQPEIWVMDATGAHPRRLTFTPAAPAGGQTGSVHATWSPDGNHLVYASAASGRAQIWVMMADGSQQTQLTHGNGADFPDSNVPDWSPDGTEIVFWSGFEARYGDVWVMNADGSHPRHITKTPAPLSSDNPHWSADGTRILFTSNRSGSSIDEWVVEATGGDPSLFASGMSWGTLSPRHFLAREGGRMKRREGKEKRWAKRRAEAPVQGRRSWVWEPVRQVGEVEADPKERRF